MADFDAIYPDPDGEEERYSNPVVLVTVPDPVTVRGAGNITVYVVKTCRFMFLVVLSLPKDVYFVFVMLGSFIMPWL